VGRQLVPRRGQRDHQGRRRRRRRRDGRPARPRRWRPRQRPRLRDGRPARPARGQAQGVPARRVRELPGAGLQHAGAPVLGAAAAAELDRLLRPVDHVRSGPQLHLQLPRQVHDGQGAGAGAGAVRRPPRADGLPRLRHPADAARGLALRVRRPAHRPDLRRPRATRSRQQLQLPRPLRGRRVPQPLRGWPRGHQAAGLRRAVPAEVRSPRHPGADPGAARGRLVVRHGRHLVPHRRRDRRRLRAARQRPAAVRR
jgi:hypothetical protein